MSTLPSTGYQAPAVRKAFDLLRHVAESRQALRLSDIARDLGFSKSTTYGIVQALLSVNALGYDVRKKEYSLGPTILDLAFSTWNYIHIQEFSQPYLNDLRDKIGEAVFLGGLSPHRTIVFAAADSDKPMKLSTPPGTALPIIGAVCKVFLSRLSDSQVLDFISQRKLKRYTANSIVDFDEYLLELQHVREHGYAWDDEEYLPGVRAIATDIASYRGIRLAVWAIGFTVSMTDEAKAKIIRETLHTSEMLRRAFARQPFLDASCEDLKSHL
jgi:DNA-binding IclR family transcriptional regulator